MEKKDSGNLNRLQHSNPRLLEENQHRRSDYQQRSLQHPSNTKSSQMSISISVQQNQSAANLNKVMSAKQNDSSKIKEINSSQNAELVQVEPENDKRPSSQENIDQHTLSISAGHGLSNEAHIISGGIQTMNKQGSLQDASTEQLNMTPLVPLQTNDQEAQQQQEQDQQLALIYASSQQEMAQSSCDDAMNKMFEVDMADDVQSQLVVSNNKQQNNGRPASQHDQRNARGGKKKDGVIIRKKRVKSTRPGGIRGGILIQDKYSSQTPASTKKTRLTSMKRQCATGEQSSANMMLGQSTRAGSNHQQSSKLYMSYAPTGLFKVGNRSVQRLRPRVPSSNTSQGYRPTTAAVRPFVAAHQNKLASEYTSFSQLNSSNEQTANRPFSQFSRSQLNKFASMKAAMRHADNNLSSQFQVAQQDIGQEQMQTEPVYGGETHSNELNQMTEYLSNQDGFKLVSQFENEQAALAYASELQRYYDSMNMDVKVQIEANLTQMDDTEDKRYLQEAMEAYQREKSGHTAGSSSFGDASRHEDPSQEEGKRLAKQNIQNAFSTHFKKVEQVQLRAIKGVTKRNADLTDPKFEKRVNVKKPSKAEPIEYDRLTKSQLKEVKMAQDQIYGVIKQSAKLPQLSYQNQGAQERRQAVPNFKFDEDIRKTQIRHNANLQAKILQKLGVLPGELQGEVQHASQVMSNDNKIPKSMAKFYQREQRLKKLFDAQVSQWQKEAPTQDIMQNSFQNVDTSSQVQEPFDVDVRLYKERGDDYCIIGNKLQYRACEEAKEGQNFSHKQALETKNGFDPIRIRLRIMPISRAPLAQGKTPDYYFREAAKKSLSGDLTSAIEQLKRGLLINPNHYICRFNHGVLMFKFGLVREACKDFQVLTQHAHGRKDPWCFFNYATCLIQLGYPEKPLYQQKQEFDAQKNQSKQNMQARFSMIQRKSTLSTLLANEFSSISNSIDQVAQNTVSTKPDQGTTNYKIAIKMCSIAYDLGARDGRDKEIMLDALKLKGICLYRLGELIKSVKVLHKARILQAKIEEEIEERRRARENRTVDEVIGFFTQMDYKNFNKKRSKSFHFQKPNPVRLASKKLIQPRRALSWTAQELEQARKALQEEELKKKEDQETSEEEDEVDADDDSEQKDAKQSNNTPKSSATNASRRIVEQTKKAVEAEMKQEAAQNNLLIPATSRNILTGDAGRLSQLQSRRQSFENKSKDDSNATSEKPEDIASYHSILSKGSQNKTAGTAAAPEKTLRFNLANEHKNHVLRQTMMKSLVNRLSDVRNQIIRQNKRTMNEDKIEELMAKLQKQREELAADRRNLKMTKHEYAIFRKTYLDLRKQSDQIVDEDEPMLRLKNMVLRQFDEYEEEYEDCNIMEVTELKKRKAILKWINEDDLIMQLIKAAAQNLQKMGEVGEDPVEARLNTKFVKKLLKVAAVQFEEVEGTHIETLLDICEDQSQMDGIMKDLRFKVAEMCRQFEKEINRGNQELTAIEPKLDELKILRGERHIDVEDQNLGNEDKMITRLRDALNNDGTTPGEVRNILTTDIFEKEKLKLQLQYMNGASDDEVEQGGKIFIRRKQIAGKSKRNMDVRQDMRYTERHIEMIRNQFELRSNERNYKVLEKLMRHLRYFKRHDPDVRKQIYKHSEFVEFPAQTVIFNKGDDADYMYIILKGRVSCETTHKQYKDIPSIGATVKDGEAFGEAVIIDKESRQKESGGAGDQHQENQNKQKRQATCRTVEVTRAIRLVAQIAKQIEQPTMRKELDQSTGSVQQAAPPSQGMSSVESGSLNASVDGIVPHHEMRDFSVEELNKKIAFLQSFEMFRDIKNRDGLVSMANHMDLVTFKYGEFLTRAGDRPPGMYLIKSGQCVVGLTQTSIRMKNYRDIPGQREPIFDKNPLFNRFDPENSLLNNVEMQDRVFQNGRIYVENNEQIRGKIMYHDFIQFSQLFPKNQFGGRCLIPFDIYLQLKRSYFGPQSLARPDNEPLGDIKKQENYHMKSFLDVVANSACVEAFLISKQAIEYLTSQNLKNIFEYIVQEKEADRPYQEEKIVAKKQEMLDSHADRLATVRKIMMQNKIAKYGVMAVKEPMENL